MRQSAIKRNIQDWVARHATKRVVVHAVFWLFMLCVFVFTGEIHGAFAFHLSNQLISVFFYGVIVYFNLYYLIPNYLTEKKFWKYCLLLVASVLLITPIKMLVLYFKFSGRGDMQAALIDEQPFVFLGIFVFAGASTIVKIVADWLQYLREKQVLQTQNMQSELRFLKSQINPHFLFNTLNNLYALALKKDDRAPEIVIKLSEMMRYMLYECNEKKVLLEKEVNYVKNYLDLERIRQGDNVDIDFEVRGEVADQRIAPLLFIPFLENSFKHGINQVIEQGFVKIRLDVNNGDLHFKIINSKAPALPAQEHRKSGGIGLVNVRRRLNLVYPNRHDLQIANQADTYSIDLQVKLN